MEHEFDIRIIIQEPPTNDWLQPDAVDTRTAGMFEVRRKDYEVFLRSLEEHSSVDKNYWNARTVYIVSEYYLCFQTVQSCYFFYIG